MKKRINTIPITNIDVSDNRRSLRKEKVRHIADAISQIGLQTPISVRKAKRGFRLVTGRHRLEAYKLLGRDEIEAVVTTGGKSQAKLWELSENLHRAELSALDRAEAIDRWRRELKRKAGVAQDARPGGKQPNDTGITMAAGRLGFSRDTVRRAKAIARIAPKAKAEAKKLGYDNNQTILTAIAKAHGLDNQLSMLKTFHKEKNSPGARKFKRKRTKAKKKSERKVVVAEAAVEVSEVERLTRKLRNERKRRRKAQKRLGKALKARTQPSSKSDAVETTFTELMTLWANAPTAVRDRFLREVDADHAGCVPGRRN